MPIKFFNEEKGKIIGHGIVDCVTELAALHFPAINLAKSAVQTGKALHIQQQSGEISFSEIEKVCRSKLPDHAAGYCGIISAAADICLRSIAACRCHGGAFCVPKHLYRLGAKLR